MTTKVRDRVAVECPITEALSRVEAYFERRRDADGRTRLALRASVGDAAGLAIDRVVSVDARRGRDDDNLNDVIHIRWEPATEGPFPTFEGKLYAWAEHDPNISFVELDGTYEVPLGAAGAAFDAVLGEKIAQQSVRALLLELARGIGTPVTLRDQA